MSDALDIVTTRRSSGETACPRSRRVPNNGLNTTLLLEIPNFEQVSFDVQELGDSTTHDPVRRSDSCLHSNGAAREAAA